MNAIQTYLAACVILASLALHGQFMAQGKAEGKATAPASTSAKQSTAGPSTASPAGAPRSVVPTVSLEASPSYPRDKKIVLSIKGIDDTKARVKWWIRSNDGRSAPDYEVYNIGKSCAVWATPGKYEALVTIGVPDAAEIYWIDIEFKFEVVSSGPQPSPVVPDPVVPTPDPPVSNFGDVVSEIVKFAGPVRDDNKSEGAKIIADAYRRHGALAAKGEYADQNLLAEATSSDFVYSLGLSRYLRYRPMMSRVREHMAALMAEGKLKDKDMKQWAKLWEEYAKGFDKVAQDSKQSGGIQNVQPAGAPQN